MVTSLPKQKKQETALLLPFLALFKFNKHY